MIRLAENYELLTKMLSSGKVSPKDTDAGGCLFALLETINIPIRTAMLKISHFYMVSIQFDTILLFYPKLLTFDIYNIYKSI